MCKLYEPRNTDFWGKCIWKECFTTEVIPCLKKFKRTESRNVDFWDKCFWKECFTTEVIPCLKKFKHTESRNADFWDKCFWKKRFSVNVVPYLKTVCTSGWIDMGSFGGPKCDFCYDYFLQDLDRKCEMCGQFNYPPVYVEQTLHEYLEKSSGCYRGKWVRIAKATKFEDVKNIHKKLGYFALVPFKCDFMATYFRIMGRDTEL